MHQAAKRAILEKLTQQFPRMMETLKAMTSHDDGVLFHKSLAPTLAPMPKLPTTNNNVSTISSQDPAPTCHSHMINHVYGSKGVKQTLDMSLANPKKNQYGLLASKMNWDNWFRDLSYHRHRHYLLCELK